MGRRLFAGWVKQPAKRADLLAMRLRQLVHREHGHGCRHARQHVKSMHTAAGRLRQTVKSW
jgi:hypothetical protein